MDIGRFSLCLSLWLGHPSHSTPGGYELCWQGLTREVVLKRDVLDGSGVEAVHCHAICVRSQHSQMLNERPGGIRSQAMRGQEREGMPSWCSPLSCPFTTAARCREHHWRWMCCVCNVLGVLFTNTA